MSTTDYHSSGVPSTKYKHTPGQSNLNKADLQVLQNANPRIAALKESAVMEDSEVGAQSQA